VRDDTEYRWDDAFQQYRLNTCIAQKLAPYAKLAMPDVFTTVEEQERLDVLQTDIKKYAESMEAKLITGEASVDEIPTMVETLKSMGVDEVLSIYQAAYDRWANS
jgi:putative aldouronate transport system substrate-binding protein